MNKGQFTASLHTHVRSIFDAQIEAKDLCDKIKELGGRGCAITDHGVLSSIEDYRPAFADADLKLIPGVELYIDGEILGKLHLIVLAKNDNGYRGISKMVTESNRILLEKHKNSETGKLADKTPVLPEKVLFDIASEYKGDIICLSACMQGVISAIFLKNDKVRKNITSLEIKRSKHSSSENPDYKKAVYELGIAQKAVEELMNKRDIVKATSEATFTKREKAIEKAKTEGKDVTQDIAKLEADKNAKEAAIKELPAVKEALDKAKKEVTRINRIIKDKEGSIEKYNEFTSQIEELKKEYQNEESLFAEAKAKAVKYNEAFGLGCFYLEVQNHGIPEEEICYKGIISIAKDTGIPVVATNDVHILTSSKEDRLRRQVLRSKRFSDDKFEEEQTGDDQLYLKTDDELFDALIKIMPEDVAKTAIDNISVIFDQCNVEFKTGKHYPKFSDGDANAIIEEEVKKGIAWRFPNGYPEGKEQIYKDRIEYELKIIESMGYSDYHLVVKDFLEYGRLLGFIPKDKLDEAPLTIPALKQYIKDHNYRNQGLMIGPGRGSAVGSLVCYVLGITALDPLKYDLLFERFLNPERVSMPDIDSDLAKTTRDKVIKYVQNKYGINAVCGIMTTDAIAPKGALRLTAKYYGLRKNGEALTSLGDTLAKDIPGVPGTSFDTKVSDQGAVEPSSTLSLYDYLLKKHTSADAQEIIKWAKAMEGSFTAYGAHAAGIVISDNSDVSEYIPLRYNDTLGMMTSQCDMVQVEDNGLLKFDFLGLKTLDVITETLRMIETKTGKVIDPLKVDLNDSKVYKEILASGRTSSVFQLESNGMKSMAKRLKPDCFEDLILLVAAYRPGPMQYLESVCEVKAGNKEPEYITPELKPILENTYGAVIYQEQVMRICQDLAGFSLGHADVVRRYMSKKKQDKLAHEREQFVDGCVSNGIQKEAAEELFTQMEEFAKYAFNKSHAAVYAFNAYLTAYLKCYYPEEFFASVLNWNDTPSKLAAIMQDAKSFGVKISLPDINLSKKDFYVTDDNSVRFGFGQIKGISNAADSIIEVRKDGSFKNLKDFVIRVNPNSTVLNNLIEAGAFDQFSDNRQSLKKLAEELKDIVPDYIKKQKLVSTLKVLVQNDKIGTLTTDELVKFQEDNGLYVVVKEATTPAKIDTKLKNAENSLATIGNEISLITEKIVAESKQDRLNREKELLGAYVSDNPLKYYEDVENAKDISDIDEGIYTIYGIVNNLSIKNRKSDGAKMAFFNLEDMSGNIDVCVFTKAYASFGDIIKENGVFKVTGKVTSEEHEDSEGNVSYEYKMYASDMEPVSEKVSSYMIPISSYAVFHVEHESSFRENYEDTKGHKLYFYDKSMSEMRLMNYKVNDRVLSIPGAEEVMF